MSSHTAGFIARMRKRAVDAQGETTPDSEGPCDKCPRRSGLEKEAHKSSVVIVADSPEQAPDVMLALKGVAQGALQKACATLEDQAPPEGSPKAN